MSLPSPKPGSGLNTISFDLDGTLAEPTWPNPWVGKPIKKGVDAAKAYFEQGFEIVIFTARPLSHQNMIVDWLEENDLTNVIYDVICNKPRAAMYVDDRAVKFPEEFRDDPVLPPLQRPMHKSLEPYGTAAHEWLSSCQWLGCIDEVSA